MTKQTETSLPKKVSVEELVQQKKDPRPRGSAMDEADGAMFSRVTLNMDEADVAMFSRVPSKKETNIHNQETTLCDEIASPFDDVIIPVSFNLIEDTPPSPTLPYNETTKLVNNTDSDNSASSRDLGDGSGEPRDGGTGMCFVDHASFTRGSIEMKEKQKQQNQNHNQDEQDTCVDNLEATGEPDEKTVVIDNESKLNDDGQLDLQESPEEEVSRYRIRDARSLIFPFSAVLVCLADIGTDIQLADSYRKKGEMDLFYATLACIVAPSVIMAVVDLSWLWLDRGSVRGGNCARAWRVIAGVLSFGRIVRAFSHMYHLVRKVTGPNRKWHKQRALEEKRDCYMLDFINAFAESCPQLFVQMYLLYKYDLPLEFIRVISLLMSWVSIAWTYAAYYRCSREAISGRQDVNFFGFILFFWSVLSTLAARVICIVLFLVYFRLWIGAVFLTVHYVIMLIWIIWQKPELEGTTNTRFGRFMYSLLFAYVSMMCFMNLKNTRARIRMILFYLLIYLENIIISGLVIWRMTLNDKTSGKPMNFIVLPVGCVLHVTFLCLYYKCLHPKIGSRYSKPLLKEKNQS